jgi:hypothetical protein
MIEGESGLEIVPPYYSPARRALAIGRAGEEGRAKPMPMLQAPGAPPFEARSGRWETKCYKGLITKILDTIKILKEILNIA